MEAKDTVIRPELLGVAIISHPELPMGQAISIEQAEISFKAGIKVVVDWGAEWCPHDHRVFANRPKRACDICLEAKLKEWGL